MAKYKVKDSSGHSHTLEATDVAVDDGFIIFFTNTPDKQEDDEPPLAIFFKPVSIIEVGPHIVTDL